MTSTMTMMKTGLMMMMMKMTSCRIYVVAAGQPEALVAQQEAQLEAPAVQQEVQPEALVAQQEVQPEVPAVQ
jgi:hypothetical protein